VVADGVVERLVSAQRVVDVALRPLGAARTAVPKEQDPRLAVLLAQRFVRVVDPGIDDPDDDAVPRRALQVERKRRAKVRRADRDLPRIAARAGRRDRARRARGEADTHEPTEEPATFRRAHTHRMLGATRR
jgi:hypothetical protein